MITDMRLDDRYQLVSHTNSDNMLINGDDCFMQSLRLEAASCAGDLWYDPEWGWSLIEFSGRYQDDLTELEIEQRVRTKLKRHEEIDTQSVAVEAIWIEDIITVDVTFRRLGTDDIQQLKINLSRTEIEVIPID